MVNFVEPNVELVGKTVGMPPFHLMETDDFSDTTEDLIEFAGRTCYQSFDKPNEKTRKNKDYIQNIIKQKHFSVLEHASASFYITGVSRAFTHELIRHRHLSYSQMSQRYVDESDLNLVLPPLLRDFLEEHEDRGAVEELTYALEATYAGEYQATVELLSEKTDASRKQVREAARAFLPNMAETRIVVTGNFRAWREFLEKRLSPAADAEMQEVAHLILKKLMVVAPSVFEDVNKEFSKDEEVEEPSSSSTGQEQEPLNELFNIWEEFLSQIISEEKSSS